MQRPHEENLTRRLETVMDIGMVFIYWSELRRWYDAQRISITTYRDIEKRWEELTKSKSGHLMSVYGSSNEGIWLFSENSMKKVRDL